MAGPYHSPNGGASEAIPFSPVLDRIPPQATDAEQAVLGCLLFSPGREALDTARSIIEPGSFYRDPNRYIYEACLSLDERGEPVDMLTVAAELEARGRLEKAGGKQYLIDCRESVPGPSFKLAHHCRRVQRAALRRAMIMAGGEIIGLAYNEEVEVEDAVSQSEAMVLGLATQQVTQGLVHISEFLPEAYQVASQAAETGVGMVGVTTGFEDLDALTSGLPPSSLIIVAGRPGAGKSAFAIGGLGYNCARATGDPVAVFSLEMSRLEQAFRFLAYEARLDSNRIRGGHLGGQTAGAVGTDGEALDDWAALVGAMQRLCDMPIWLDDTCGADMLQIRSRARRLKSERGLSMVIVDYVQLVKGRGQARGATRHDEVTGIVRELKQMARELAVPVVALSQLSRKVEQRPDKRPILSDLMESGGIEAEADQVHLLYRPRYYEPEAAPTLPGEDGQEWGEPIEVNLAKHRNGPTGIVTLNVVLRYGLFREYGQRFHDPTDLLAPVGTWMGKNVYE